MNGFFLILLLGAVHSATLSTWKVKTSNAASIDRLSLGSFIKRKTPKRRLFLGALLGGGEQAKMERKLEVVKKDIEQFAMKISTQRDQLKDLMDTREKVDDINSEVSCWDAMVEGLMNDRVDELSKLEEWINGL
jgi:predicted component of type VI protein secretion system